MNKTKRIKELEKALKPFAKCAAFNDKNPFLRNLGGKNRLCKKAFSPTLGDCRRALELVDLEKEVFEKPTLDK